MQPPELPLATLFPGRLSFGLRGHNGFLRFPCTCADMCTFIDDPFDVALAATRTGLHGELLYRGFIAQSLLFALLRIEPRTPRSSFSSRDRRASSGVDSQLVCSMRTRAYPPGFSFPP